MVEKPLKRLACRCPSSTGLKPGVNQIMVVNEKCILKTRLKHNCDPAKKIKMMIMIKNVKAKPGA